MSAKERREHFGETYDPDRNPRVTVESMSVIGNVDVPGVTILERKTDDMSDAWLVRLDHSLDGIDHFIISGVETDNGWSCAAFPATDEWKPLSFKSVAGGYAVSHRGVIEELADKMKYNHE